MDEVPDKSKEVKFVPADVTNGITVKIKRDMISGWYSRGYMMHQKSGCFRHLTPSKNNLELNSRSLLLLINRHCFDLHWGAMVASETSDNESHPLKSSAIKVVVLSDDRWSSSKWRHHCTLSFWSWVHWASIPFCCWSRYHDVSDERKSDSPICQNKSCKIDVWWLIIAGLNMEGDHTLCCSGLAPARKLLFSQWTLQWNHEHQSVPDTAFSSRCI